MNTLICQIPINYNSIWQALVQENVFTFPSCKFLEECETI